MYAGPAMQQGAAACSLLGGVQQRVQQQRLVLARFAPEGRMGTPACCWAWGSRASVLQVCHF